MYNERGGKMKKNTWGEVLMKMMAIGLVIVGLHKHQLIVSSLENLDISYLTSFKNLNMKDVVNDPLHLVTYDDSASLLVHQVIFNNQTLETDGTLNEEKKSIYIYNTHQYENYENGGVMDGALYLKKKLEDLGYEVIFETNDFEAYKRNNNMDLTETYPTSRIFLEKQLESHGPFDLIIDFHRDSVSKEASTLIADGKSFAKMMMVISLSSKNYETVEANSIEIHAAAEKIQPGIMRADFKREYAYYNQQYAPSMILIEVGAQYNSYEEVTRSIDVLASAIDTCFKGEKIK